MQAELSPIIEKPLPTGRLVIRKIKQLRHLEWSALEERLLARPLFVAVEDKVVRKGLAEVDCFGSLGFLHNLPELHRSTRDSANLWAGRPAQLTYRLPSALVRLTRHICATSIAKSR